MSGEITFGVWLKQSRKGRGVGPDTLADQIGCSPIALLKIEAGERRPSRQVALLVADFFAIPEDEREAFVAFARSGQSVSTEYRVPSQANRTQNSELRTQNSLHPGVLLDCTGATYPPSLLT